MRGAPIRPRPSERLPREPGARRVDDDDVRGPGAVAELLDRLPDVAGEERRVRDPVEVGVLQGTCDRLLRDLDPPDRERVGREREPDRPDAAVEIPDRLPAGQPGELARDPVQHLRHLGVRLEERVGAGPEAQAAKLLLDRVVAPEQPRGQVRHLGRRVVDRPVHGAHLGEAPQHLGEVAGLEALAGRGHELHEHLARVARFAVDEVP